MDVVYLALGKSWGVDAVLGDGTAPKTGDRSPPTVLMVQECSTLWNEDSTCLLGRIGKNWFVPGSQYCLRHAGPSFKHAEVRSQHKTRDLPILQDLIGYKTPNHAQDYVDSPVLLSTVGAWWLRRLVAGGWWLVCKEWSWLSLWPLTSPSVHCHFPVLGHFAFTQPPTTQLRHWFCLATLGYPSWCLGMAVGPVGSWHSLAKTDSTCPWMPGTLPRFHLESTYPACSPSCTSTTTCGHLRVCTYNEYQR